MVPARPAQSTYRKEKKSEKEKAADGRIIGSPLMSSSWPMDCVLRGHALGFSSPIPRASFGNLHYINIRCILYFCSFPTKLIEILPFFPRCLVVILARCPTQSYSAKLMARVAQSRSLCQTLLTSQIFLFGNVLLADQTCQAATTRGSR